MKKHALPLYFIFLLCIIICSQLGYFPANPALANSQTLNEVELNRLFFNADPYVNRQVSFTARIFSTTSELFADYIQAYLEIDHINKPVIILVNCQKPEVQVGDNIYVKGYVKGDLKAKSKTGEVWSTPLIVGTAINKTEPIYLASF